MEQLDQGTQEWLDWRRQGIGASEVPIIMGESDFSTPRTIWKEKTGRLVSRQNNLAMQRGHDTEPKIRALYELYNDLDMPPFLFQHPEHTFMRASLDGWNEKERRILEIKYPGADTHAIARDGKRVPPKYYGQVQAQIFVVDAKSCDYVSYDGAKIAVVSVLPDLEYQARMLKACQEFWAYVQNDVPPPMTDRDYYEYEAKEDVELFTEWKQAKLAGLKSTTNDIRDKIIERIGEHKRVLCAGVRVIRNAKGVVTISVVTKQAQS